jgi:predicted house-cleaning noncanonical NTP pyrophosphatase (MazG superfamily)
LPCWKLVRDGVAREVAGSENAIVLQFSDGALERLLRVKIVEEAIELAESGGLEEAADLYEALSQWLKVRGFSWDELLKVASEKRARRGGFEKGFVVVWLDRDSC